MPNLANKVILITGGAGGLGKAMSEMFSASGAIVGMLDNNESVLQSASASIPNSIPLLCDISDRNAVEEAVNKLVNKAGRLDVLINNAAYFYYAPLVDMPEEQINKMLDVGLKGSYWALQAATKHLIKSGGGSVINMSSVAVSVSIKNAAVYSTIKGALDTLTRQQAVELAEYNIRVNAIAPGPVKTPGAGSVITAEGWKSRSDRSPLKKLASDTDIAKIAAFLASDEASSISGVTLKVDCALTVVGY